MRRRALDVLCFVLAASMACSGCTSLRTGYRKTEAERAAFSVACYWEDFSGEKHYVRGLSVTLSPRETGSVQDISVLTPKAQPVVFKDLPPGKYRLTISEGDTQYVSEPVTLRPGRELRARFQVHGRAAREVAADVAEGLGKAFVIVATVAVIVAIASLEAELEEEGWLPSQDKSDDELTIVIR